MRAREKGKRSSSLASDGSTPDLLQPLSEPKRPEITPAVLRDRLVQIGSAEMITSIGRFNQALEVIVAAEVLDLAAELCLRHGVLVAVGGKVEWNYREQNDQRYSSFSLSLRSTGRGEKGQLGCSETYLLERRSIWLPSHGPTFGPLACGTLVASFLGSSQ